jgi:general secretion pathway protein N
MHVKAVYLAAAAFYVSLLIITAPASLLDSPLKSLVDDRLSLANCQGTIWQGSATPTLKIGKQSRMSLHTLHWHIRPLALLTGQLKAALTWDDMASITPTEMTISRKSVALSNLQLSLPAEIIGELSPFLKPAQLSGNLNIESRALTYSDGQLQGNATARWNQAGSAMSTIHPLGDYRIDIEAAKNNLHATLSTLRGALLLDGQGNWSPAQKFHFNGTARAAPESQAMLSELLHHLGPETAPGVYQINL